MNRYTKKLEKRIIYLQKIPAFLLVISMLFPSCSRRFNYPEAEVRNEIKFVDEEMVDEVLFMMELKSATEFLINASDVAVERAYSVNARDFAEDLGSDLQWTIRDLEFLFAKVRIKRSYTMAGHHAGSLMQLRGQAPQSFDRAYFGEVLKTLDWVAAQMELYARSAKHRRIRTFCIEKQEKYQSLLDQLQQRQEKLLSLNP